MKLSQEYWLMGSNFLKGRSIKNFETFRIEKFTQVYKVPQMKSVVHIFGGLVF